MKTTPFAYMQYDVQGTTFFVSGTAFTERETEDDFWTVRYSEGDDYELRRFDSEGAAHLFANEKIDEFVGAIYGLRINDAPDIERPARLRDQPSYER